MRKIIAISIVVIAVVMTIRMSRALLLDFSDINMPSLGDNFSEVHFMAPGNDFGGSIFRLTARSLSGGIDISLNSDSKHCTKLVRGLYYNSQRGKRIRPLDEYTLDLLEASNPNYSQLQLTGGLYTSCDDPYSIFGFVEYDRSGTKSYLIAGVQLDYVQNGYIAGFADNLQYFNNQAPIGYLRDSYGGIGFIGGTLSDHSGFITYLNNGGSINSGFTFSGSDIISSTGTQIFTGSSGLETAASNTLRNLIIQGTVGVSQSLDTKEISAILGNPENKTVIYATNDISNADIINQALQNTEKLCRGKTWDTNTLLPASTEDVLCFQNTDLSIDLLNDYTKYADKTIILKSGNVIFSETMNSTASPIELFVDQGNLYLNNTMTSKQNFDAQGYPDDAGTINSGMFIRGNILINGLIIGGSPANETGFTHKLHLQGKLSSFNTPLTPTTGRITLIQNLLGNGFAGYINLQNIFVRNCGLSGDANDGTACGFGGAISLTPLVILDGNYFSRLLNE